MEFVDADDDPVRNARPEIGTPEIFAASAKFDSAGYTFADSRAKTLQLHGKKPFEPRRTHSEKIHSQRCTE